MMRVYMSVITRRGDDGQTDLMFGRRCAKNSLRMEAIGTVDELNAALGLARSLGLSEDTTAEVDAVQQALVTLMGELAVLPADYPAYAGPRITEGDVECAEAAARRAEAAGVRFTGWVRPGCGATPGAAQLGVARTVCRRAERCLLALHAHEPLPNPTIARYLNRLSDLIWLIARRESLSL